MKKLFKKINKIMKSGSIVKVINKTSKRKGA